MENMIYAPVMITVLNRDKHLKRCIESLKKCKYADKTEIYISVDYPPNEKYISGYLSVLEYLKEEIQGFLAVHIYIHKKNLGAINNIKYIENKVFERFDRLIATEDDNEFSYNFLEYMDKGLEIFKDNKDVLNICAVEENIPWKTKKETVIFGQLCPAYGLGYWREKEKILEKVQGRYFREELLKNKRKRKLLYDNSKMCYQQFAEGILWGKKNIFWIDENTPSWCDTLRSIYAICEDKCFVIPKVSKACNHGFDGSGLNMGKRDINPLEVWRLDKQEDFEYIYDYNIENAKKNTVYLDRYIYEVPKLYLLKARIKVGVYNIYINTIRGKKYFKN